LKSNCGSRIAKKIVGKPIIVGERTLIPVIEISAFLKEICIGKNVGEMIIADIIVTPTEFKVIQSDEEWTIKITETCGRTIN
jgi:hypothetical protein